MQRKFLFFWTHSDWNSVTCMMNRWTMEWWRDSAWPSLSLHGAHDKRVAVAPSNLITALWSETNNHHGLLSCHCFVFQRFTINPVPAFPLFCLDFDPTPNKSQSPLFIAQGTGKKKPLCHGAGKYSETLALAHIWRFIFWINDLDQYRL